jgi:hypothetical protein
MWFNLAAAQSLPPLVKLLFNDDPVSYRDKVAALMTPAEVAKAQELARNWKPITERPLEGAVAAGERN